MERGEHVTCRLVTRRGVGHSPLVQRQAGAAQHCATMVVK